CRKCYPADSHDITGRDATRCRALPVGKVNRKTVPRVMPGEAHKRPPCDSMIDRQIDKPIPMPSALVVKNELKIWSITFGSMPLPESSTVTRTSPPLSSSDLTSIVRSGTNSIASMALVTRLKRTCCNCTRLPVTGLSASIQLSAHDYTVLFERALH